MTDLGSLWRELSNSSSTLIFSSLGIDWPQVLTEFEEWSPKKRIPRK